MEEIRLLLVGNGMKLTLFGIGTLAFFAAVYFRSSIQSSSARLAK